LAFRVSGLLEAYQTVHVTNASILFSGTIVVRILKKTFPAAGLNTTVTKDCGLQHNKRSARECVLQTVADTMPAGHLLPRALRKVIHLSIYRELEGGTKASVFSSVNLLHDSEEIEIEITLRKAKGKVTQQLHAHHNHNTS
jgi:hypothetical protein